MAFLQCSVHSDVLGKACAFNAIVPQQVSTQIGMTSSGGRARYPVLYLLHGLSDDHTIWARRTAIERYVAGRDVVVIMPDGGRGFYTDMAHGARYFTFMTEELPRIAEALLPVRTDRASSYLAGLSMGGYGALKMALTHPEKYTAAAAFSAVADIADWCVTYPIPDNELCFGDVTKLPGSRHDLFALARACDKAPEKPRIYHACGTEDGLYPGNAKLRNLFGTLDFDYEYHERPGNHSWEFWDAEIRQALDFFGF